MKRLENQIIDYISGEMDDLERIAFEQVIESDPSVKSRIQEFQSTQTVLGNWKDEDIEIPAFEKPVVDNSNVRSKIVQMRTISPWFKYAASAAAVVGVLWMSGLQINQAGNALTLSFGNPEIIDNVDQKIDMAINSALEKYAAQQTNQLAQFRNEIGSDINTMQASVQQVSNNWRNEKSAIKVMMNQLSTSQYAKFEEIIKTYQNDSSQKMDQSFADLIEYIDDKRIDDLYQIQGAFTEIVAAIDEQQGRTDELFQGLVQPVATNY